MTGNVYTIPGSGGISGGGYLLLLSPDGRTEFNVFCNYGAPATGALWFAGLGVAAGEVTIINRVEGEPMAVFNDLEYNHGGQDRLTQAGSPMMTWPWHAVVVANDRGQLIRYDLTVTGSPGGNCTVILYGLNGGTAIIQHP